MPKPVAATSLPGRNSVYPAEFASAVDGRLKRALGNGFGLDQFGVNLTTLAPGARTALRHWHSAEDEFVYVLSGAVVLVTDDGEQPMTTGDCVGFRAGVADGHKIENRSDGEAVLLEVGSRRPEVDAVEYPDDDLRVVPDGTGRRHFTRRDGTPL